MEDKAAAEMERLEEMKNAGENDDAFQRILDSIARYFDRLTEFSNRIVMMRLESAKARLDYLNSVQEIEAMSNFLDVETAVVAQELD